MKVLKMAFAVACLLMLSVAPAAADKPRVLVEEQTFSDMNPCSGEWHTLSFVQTVNVHEHKNKAIVHVVTDVTSDDGFVGRGVESFHEEDEGFRSNINFMMSNAETGEKFFVKGKLVVDYDQEEPLMDTFRMRCIRS